MLRNRVQLLRKRVKFPNHAFKLIQYIPCYQISFLSLYTFSLSPSSRTFTLHTMLLPQLPMLPLGKLMRIPERLHMLGAPMNDQIKRALLLAQTQRPSQLLRFIGRAGDMHFAPVWP